MIKKELLGSLISSDTPLAFVARVRNVEKASQNTVTATSYRCEETGCLIVTNSMPRALSPFTGKEMAKSENVEPVVMDDSDFGPEDMVQIATVEKEGVTLDIYTLASVAEKIEGEDFICPITGEVVTAACKSKSSGDDEDEAEDFTEIDVEEEDPETEDDSDDEEDDEEEDESEDDESEEEDESDDEMEEDEEATIVVDLTATYSVDVPTVRVVELAANRYAVVAFDKNSEQTQIVGHLNRDKFSQELASVKSERLRDVLVAAMNAQENLSVLGFEPILATVSVSEQVAARMQEGEERASVAAEEVAADRIGAFEQSLGIAVAGMNKGIYENPLVDAITQELSRYGIENASSIAYRVVENSSDNYMRAAVEKAKALSEMSDEVREAVAVETQGTLSVLAKPETASSAIPVATAHLSRLVQETASFETAKVAALKPTSPAAGKRLFSI